MSVEVREVVIKGIITDGDDAGNKTAGGNDKANSEEIIKVCVEKVLEILKEKTER